MSRETSQTVTFWDLPDVTLVLAWVLTFTVLLLGIGVAVLMPIVQSNARITHASTQPAPTRITSPHR
jgi:hypothetical protein